MNRPGFAGGSGSREVAATSKPCWHPTEARKRPAWRVRRPAPEHTSQPGPTSTTYHKCEVETIGGTAHTRCVLLSSPETWFAYARPQVGRSFWHGSLLEDQQDASGTHYRRNRYYDPSTGRFTQEDPIGIAGGLNLYGFANGDPVNFSDPFGLCKKDKDGNEDPECRAVINMLVAATHLDGTTDDARSALLAAADAYERWTGDVVFVDAPDLATFSKDGNYWGGDTNEYRVRLNSALGGPDLMFAAWHESQHMKTGGNIGGDTGRDPQSRANRYIVHSREARLYRGMPAWFRAQAVEITTVLRYGRWIP